MTKKKVGEIQKGDEIVNLGIVLSSIKFDTLHQFVIHGPCMSAAYFWFDCNHSLFIVDKIIQPSKKSLPV